VANTEQPLVSLAERIADRIAADLNDRRGFHLDTLDDELQREIRDKWMGIIEAELAVPVVHRNEWRVRGFFFDSEE